MDWLSIVPDVSFLSKLSLQKIKLIAWVLNICNYTDQVGGARIHYIPVSGLALHTNSKYMVYVHGTHCFNQKVLITSKLFTLVIHTDMLILL